MIITWCLFHQHTEETRYPRKYIKIDILGINGFSTNFSFSLSSVPMPRWHGSKCVPWSITGWVFHKSIKFRKEILMSKSAERRQILLHRVPDSITASHGTLNNSKQRGEDNRQLWWNDSMISGCPKSCFFSYYSLIYEAGIYENCVSFVIMYIIVLLIPSAGGVNLPRSCDSMDKADLFVTTSNFFLIKSMNFLNSLIRINYFKKI